MALHRWWANDPRERFWLESTDRPDIGADLRAPLTDDSGRDNWRYTIARETQVGDLVFHYDKKARAITSVSRIAGAAVEAPILWAARGSYARERGARPQVFPGFQVPLDRHQKLSTPVTLEQLRGSKDAVGSMRDRAAARSGEPLYFPFELAERDLRPLQGYAFKLPADFVAMFPALAAASERMAPGPVGLASEKDLFRDAILAMESCMGDHAIAGLQAERALRLGLDRVSKRLFSAQARADDWAFHHGGRNEIQFNAGLDYMPDGSRAFRAGVAFSFEPSRSLPDIDVFLPKVDRFNAWIRDHPEAYSDLAMWHWQQGERSVDYAPGPIPQALVRLHTFVFLGHRQPLDSIDPHLALDAFDRFLALYRWVEGAGATIQPRGPGGASLPVGDTLRLDGGRDVDGGRWIAASTQARTLDIYLRHAEIQRRLKTVLEQEGCVKVVTEAPIGQRAIDVVGQHGGELWFYEVKVAATLRSCLREAIGQLLEYALWPGATRPARLVVVGEHILDDTAANYLRSLNEAFPIPLSYRQLSLDHPDARHLE